MRLTVERLKVQFGATVALDGVDFDVAPGEIVALIGENGAGKSTLMKVLSGAVKPDQGTMILEGIPFSPRDPGEARRRGIAMIYQELSLAPTLSVLDNIFLGMERLRGPVLDRLEMQVIAKKSLSELGHDVALDAKVRALSISDQQIVEIARASSVGCKILILDEPTSSITRKDVDKLFALMRRLKEKGVSVIYISHFIEEIKEVADRFVVLRDGRTVGGGNIATATEDEIVTMMIGRDLKDLYPRSPRTRGEEVLAVRSLEGAANKLKHADLTLHRGEVVGIFGLVGSGRTDLVRTIFGLDKVRAGEITVASFSGPAEPDARWRQGVGMVSEDRKGEGLALSRTIAENLILSNPESCRKAFMFSPSRMNNHAEQWISKLSVKCRDATQKIGELSGGNQQKIALARLLHHGVDVLLLDEPTRGIDVLSKRQIYELIDNLAAQNKAVLMISSYLPELLGVCDRVAVMNRGRISEARPVSEVTEHSIMLEAVAVEQGVT